MFGLRTTPQRASNSFNLTGFTFTRPVTDAGQNLPATSTTPARSAKVSQPKKIEEVALDEIPSVFSRFTLSKNTPFESKPVASSASCLKTTTTNLDEALHSFSSAIRDSIHRPPLELIKFDGDPMKYSRFMTTFETTVEQVELDDQRRLLYLLQHCEGKAKSLIEFCLILDPAVGYQKGKQTLKENYGRKNVIARAYVKRLADGLKIKLDDSTGMITLAQEVQECETTLSHLNYYADLNNFDNIAKIINRLPYSTQSRWIFSSAFIERDGCDPSFSDLVKFVKEEAEVARSSHTAVINSRSKKTTNGKIFTIKTTSVEPSQQKEKCIACGGGHTICEPSQQKEKCIACGGGHTIFNCTLFRNKTMADRVLLMRQKRLCDNCGKKGHIAKFCFQKSACSFDKCELKHHALLHREVDRSNPVAVPTSQSSAPSSNCASTYFTGQTCGTNAGSVYLNVVPVCVSVGNKRVNTYAFLDQGLTTTLCDRRLLEKLDLKMRHCSFLKWQ